jgi:hypothetical protein
MPANLTEAARTRVLNREEVLNLRVSIQAGNMLRRLLNQGIYGRDLEEVAERLICRELERIFGRESIAP